MAVNPGAAWTEIRQWLFPAAATLSAFVGMLLLLVAFLIIPPITGRVTDAVTGEALAGVNVTFGIERYEGFGAAPTVVHDVAVTRPSGRFWLRPFFRWRGFPLPDFGEYWLAVNQDPRSTLFKASAFYKVLDRPTSSGVDNDVTSGRYFPLTVTFEPNGCSGIVWPATCLYRSFWLGVSIPLIPVFDDAQRCGSIVDTSLRERCRQLNTYRAAFLHVDTFDDAQRGRRLCAEADAGWLSETCLKHVAGYAGNRPLSQRGAEPRLAGLFVEAVGRAVRTQQDCDPTGYYDGHLQCRAIYENGAGVRLVVITVEEWASGHIPSSVMQNTAPYPDYEGTMPVVETRSLGTIRVFRGPHYALADWTSKVRYVRLSFQGHFDVQDAFIEHFLSKFPSTLR
jgi:hypothetical protein